MRKLLLAILAAGTLAAVATSPAQASGGCGFYSHRTYWGGCRPNGYGPGPGYGVYGNYGGPGWGWRHPYYRPYGYRRRFW